MDKPVGKYAWTAKGGEKGQIGIPKEAQELIFERFRQENMSTVRRYGGSGLGLSLVKDLVAMMGGTVAVASEPGCGSTFTVELPVEEEDHD